MKRQPRLFVPTALRSSWSAPGRRGSRSATSWRAQGRRFVILEAADSVGSAWRSRWDSLVLFTPRRYDALPGLAFPGDPDGYPTRDEVDRLPRAVRGHVRAADRVRQRRPLADARTDGRLRARGSTTARSSPTRSSSRPARSSGRACRPSPASSQPRSSRRTAPATAGRAMCPRAACSSSAAATPASRSRRSSSASREVHLAIGSRQTPLPQRLLGRDLFWWLTKLGLLDEDRRLAARPACAGPRHADRLEPARAQAAYRRRA